ncbi:MAG TPA: serine/threonine-protein kinase [Polyangiaceae bacterium]|nr:serine/threonine-protein kinase [Polyangiaceae bacterium]
MLALAQGQIFASDFRVVRPLSKGGMGSVYVVEQLSTGLERALKLMHPELVRDARLRQRFEQEARIGGQIASDHITQVISAGVDPATGTPFLAMELLQGETLAERIGRHRAPLSELFEIFGQLCHGLGAAHARGIIHRDLKPENIFVAVPRQAGLPFFIKVLDFGIAKMTSTHGTGGTTTSMGTPLWMAPEQTENSRVGPPTDVWALGLIAFSILTQRLFWLRANQEDTTLPALMREILFEPLVPASQRAHEYGLTLEAEPAFDAWFARCVAREPQARFANATEAHAALVQWLSRPGAAPAPAWAPAPAGTVPGGPPEFEAVPPTVGTGTGLPGAVYAPPEPPFQGVTERGISETIAKPEKNRGRTFGIVALAGVVLLGAAALGMQLFDKSGAAGNGSVTPSAAAPALAAACPAGLARKDPAAACLCPDGAAPTPNGSCPTAICTAVADQGVIRGALKEAEASGRERCHAPSPDRSEGTITIVVSPNGHVTDAHIEGDLAGSDGARCLSDVFLATTVACFNGEPVKLKKKIELH